MSFSLAHPGLGPKRVAGELGREKWGGIVVSPNGVWKVLCRHGLNTRAKRLGLIAGYAAPYEPPRDCGPEQHINVGRPGELVGIDCFYVGRLRGTEGVIWQLTAIDIYSSFAWAELVICKQGNPTALQASRLARRVARDLNNAGWRLERVLSDNGNEFRGPAFPCTARAPRRPPQPHPRRPAANQRPCRGAAQDDPRRVLAPGVRALPLPALQRPAPRARHLPRLLQPRPRWPGPRRRCRFRPPVLGRLGDLARWPRPRVVFGRPVQNAAGGGSGRCRRRSRRGPGRGSRTLRARSAVA